jgi:Ca2+-transporting ATPase
MNTQQDAEIQTAWHCMTAEQAVGQLRSDTVTGLSRGEAAVRLGAHGPNALAEGRKRSLAGILLGQFRDFMILVLLAAALIAGLVGEPQDTIAILVIVLLNAIIGTVQEYRAERAVAALRRMAAPEARVRRNGELASIPAVELVPGDMVLLEAGDIVPADLRLVEAVDLQTDESTLTGEAHPVSKDIAALQDTDLPLGDRCNLVFKDTHVTRGRGAGVVVATGMATELGHIAGLLGAAGVVKTPLQERLTRFGRYLALAVLAICALVFAAGLLQGQPLALMFLTAVSLAVAAIPEALPAVVAVSLALGARKLSRHNALVRRLPAVETLGSVTVICADKTGTLTENRMKVELLHTADEQRDTLPVADSGEPWQALARALALNNDISEQDGKPSGEPTELALYLAARDAGFERKGVEEQLPRLAELPFDSERKRMTTLHRDGERVVAYSKGAPEVLLPLCTDRLTAAGVQALDAKAVLSQAGELAERGYRVLAVAQRQFDAMPDDLEQVEQQLTLLGLVGLIDPPRPEAAQAVADCQQAGITPVMITGDHPGTAWAIAARLGIAADAECVITGQELARLSDDAFTRRVAHIRVYARVSPQQKLRIVKALQARGEFVAMTGDGVNDAPALKRAGIGVAMGDKGSDVAREAAGMVLLDDNFATIVRAVRSGRRIFDNIRKFIKDTMSSNSGEIWTLFLAPFMGLPVPLLPIHILWINLVTDGLPGLAFTAEPEEPGLMRREPRPPDESIFAHGMWQHILWVGLFVAGLSIAAMAWSLGRGDPYWQTVVFTVLTVSQLFHSLAVRAEQASLWRIGLLSNLPMLGAVLLAMVLQLLVIYLPALNQVFYTQPLPLPVLLGCLALSSLVLVAVEAEKALVRRGWLYATPPAGSNRD